MGVRITGDIPKFRKKATRRILTARERIARDKAEELKKRAREMAPVRTGRLRESISYSRVKNGYQVGPTEFYGAFVELGTSRVGPRPFLIPAAEEVEPQFVEAMREAARQALE